MRMFLRILQLLLKNYGTLNLKYKTMKAKMQKGGLAISEKAATRKVKKGKGTITKSYPSGSEDKGSYVGFSKEARKSNSPFKSMKDSKPARPIMKTGGSTKYQAGGIKKASGMRKATTMNPTSRSTAMTALGVKKNNQYSPSKFDDNVTSYARGTGAKKMQIGGGLGRGNKWIGDLNQYLQKGVLEDIRSLYRPAKSVAKKPVAKKSATKKS